MASSLLKRFMTPVIAYWRIGSSITDQYLPLVSQTRSIVRFSKKGKKKTVKAVAKRFMRTGSGALKYWRPGKNHKMMAKSCKASRQMRKHRYVNKTQLKILNKMISGW